MSNATQFKSPSTSINATISGATNTKITNLVLSATPGTEGSVTLQTNLKEIIIKARDTTAKLQFAFTATESGTNFITIPAHNFLSRDGLDFSGNTLYIQSNKASTVVEVWELY